MLEHLRLDPEEFAVVKRHYMKELHRPTYYRPKYTDDERDSIISETNSVAQRFGYDLSHSEEVVARHVN